MYALEPRVSGAEKATPAEQRAERCQVLMPALDVVAYQRHRLDLAQEKEDAPPCERPRVEGCPYLVEVGVELLKAERADLAAQIAEAFDLLGCSGVPHVRHCVHTAAAAPALILAGLIGASASPAHTKA
jgi:hypothetical protein